MTGVPNLSLVVIKKGQRTVGLVEMMGDERLPRRTSRSPLP